MNLGIDIGSTTVKLVLLDDKGTVVYSRYERHMKGVELFRKPMRAALRESEHFEEPSYIEETAEGASKILSIGNQCGEGWLLTGEMVELINHGVNNIVCLQPFACTLTLKHSG